MITALRSCLGRELCALALVAGVGIGVIGPRLCHTSGKLYPSPCGFWPTWEDGHVIGDEYG